MQEKLFSPDTSTEPIWDKQNISCFSYLRVCCTSMVNERIVPGDILKVDRKRSPKSGDLVVAVLGEDMLIRRFLISGNKRFLLPGTDQLSVMEIDQYSCKIWGVVESIITTQFTENSDIC